MLLSINLRVHNSVNREGKEYIEMTKGKSASLVQGMGVGLQLLTELSKRLTQKTGTDEVLHFLVKERFGRNLDVVVEAIAACDWRIPASELRDRAQVWLERDFEFDEEFSPEELDAWRNLEWTTPLIELGISFEEFHDDTSHGVRAIPPLFRGQLDGQMVSYPIRVHTGRPDIGGVTEYVVIGLDMRDGHHRPQPGQKLVGSNIQGFSLVKAQYIDFDR